MGRLELSSFLDRYVAGSFSLEEVSPELARIIPATNEPETLDVALSTARSYYRKHEYIGALISLDRGLRSLSGRALEHPGKTSEYLELNSIAELLVLWEKCCTWLNVRHKDERQWIAYLDDVSLIYESIGESEAVASLKSTYAYRHLQSGRFKEAINYIERGLNEAKQLYTVRFLVEAQASLARKAEFFPKAIKLYEAVRDIDDKVSEVSQASRSLPIAWWGMLQGRGSGKARIRGLYLAFEALDLCKRSGHVGFQAQILLGLINTFIDISDYAGAYEALCDLGNILSLHQENFPGLTARTEQMRTILEMIASGTRIADRSVGMGLSNTKGVVSSIAWEPLQGALQKCLEVALEENPYLSRALLCLAAELVTESLFEKNCPEAMVDKKKRTLQEKNLKLKDIGVYSGEDFVRMEQLRDARNKIFHGMPGDLKVRSMGRTIALLGHAMWLVELIRLNDLVDFVPKGSKDERSLSKFLG